MIMISITYFLINYLLIFSHLYSYVFTVDDIVINQKHEEVATSKREAYAALFYGEDEGFLLGLRVLGQSLRQRGSTREMVALCLPDVSNEVRFLLAREGWTIYPVNPDDINYEGPYKGHVAKLLVLTLTQYKKIVLIDTDVIGYEGADDIFNCGSYCATMRHSNIFNSGVMVLTPSQTHFHNIIKMLETWDPLDHSHKGGDQDILNVYFSPITLALSYNKTDPNYKPPTYAQLPFEYNMDAGMYYLRSSWLIPRKDFRFLHYTFGPIRPWQWLSYPLFDLNHEWQDIRFQLRDPTKEMFTSFFRYLPFYAVLFLFVIRVTTFQSFHRHLASTVHSLLSLSSSEPLRCSSGTIMCVCKNVFSMTVYVFPIYFRFCKMLTFISVLMCVPISIYMVPMHVRPLVGWLMFTFSFTVLIAHIFEFTFWFCHYGCYGSMHGGATRECPPVSNSGGRRHTLRQSNHRQYLHSAHLKFVLITFFYVLLGLAIVINVGSFASRVKTAVLIGLFYLGFLYYSIDSLVGLYTHYTLPSNNSHHVSKRSEDSSPILEP